MPPFQVHTPATVEDAVRLGSQPDHMYLAGGTDLLVNLKHRLHRPAAVVSLGAIDALRSVDVSAGALHIGAMVSLEALRQHPETARFPGLRQALASIAGPHHRRMGTIGGNVLLDTRCLFFNQTESWRRALGSCLKAEGDWCHVIGSARACVAAQSSDSVPMLAALDATIELQTTEGSIERRIRGLFTKDGRYDRMLTVPRTALLTGIRIPLPSPGHRSIYRKVRARQSIDFPQASVAVAVDIENGVVAQLALAFGAMLPAPRVLVDPDEVIGQALSADNIDAVAVRAGKLARPQVSIHGEREWRRRVIEIETRRALTAISEW